MIILTYHLSCIVSKLWPIIGQIFAIDIGFPHFNALTVGDPLQISGQTLPLKKLEGFSYQMLEKHDRNFICLECDGRMDGLTESLWLLQCKIIISSMCCTGCKHVWCDLWWRYAVRKQREWYQKMDRENLRALKQVEQRARCAVSVFPDVWCIKWRIFLFDVESKL